MKSVQFTSIIKIRGINPYISVSPARAKALKLGWRKPLPVLLKINGSTKVWHLNMMPTGNGSFYLYLHGEVRKTSGTKVGDRVQVDIRFDANYRNGPSHPMPAWFSIPLENNPQAKDAWEALSPSRQKEILRYFSWLKSAEAKTRNVERALHVLSGQKGRFMARSWNQ